MQAVDIVVVAVVAAVVGHFPGNVLPLPLERDLHRWGNDYSATQFDYLPSRHPRHPTRPQKTRMKMKDYRPADWGK